MLQLRPLVGGLLCGLGLLPTLALAGVDDAALIDANSCSIDLWHTRIDGGGYQNYVSPTCRPGGNYQFTAVFGNEHEEGESEQVYGLEAKMLFTSLEAHGYGLGLVVGSEYLTETSRWETQYALVPLTLGFADERALVHFNLGWERERSAETRNALTWGLGSEVGIVGPLVAIAKVFGNDRSSSESSIEVGPRLALLDEKVLIDALFERELGGEHTRAYTLALTYAF